MMFGGMMTRGVMRGFRCSSSPFASFENKGWMGFEKRASSSLVGEEGNVPPGVASKLGAKLHLQPHHPLNILRKKIYHFFDGEMTDSFGEKVSFSKFDDFAPQVSIEQNFDSLLVPKDHICRLPQDTYYTSPNVVLRTHTSAHQTMLLKEGESSFLVMGDCYRRDTVDATHFPIFHQLEGVRVFNRGDVSEEEVERDLKHTLTQLFIHLMGNDTEVRWNDDYFPFTDPSFEMEVKFRDDWLEVLGCGLIHRNLLDSCGLDNKVGWAFGQGIERLAMILYQIPDIRLFWSADKRFLRQFDDSHINLPSSQIPPFQSFSKFPACKKDVSLWVPEGGFHVHDVFELVREVAGETVEDVELVSTFVHPKTNRESHCYRVNYRSLERSLTNEEVNEMQEELRERLAKIEGLELR